MASHRPGTNYYEILEVPVDAPQNEIHRAYQKAKQTYSQDNPALYSMFSKEEARELVRMIEEAYHVLGNQGSRRSYDDALAAGLAGQAESPSALAPSAANPAHLASIGGLTGTSAGSASAAAHETLPDFAAPDADGGEFVVRRKEATKAPAPPGQGRTSLSSYKIDDAMEAEISAREEWDGAFLARVRNYKNVSLDKLSDATRISRGYLASMEANDYASLPAPVFVRGFVAQTARILGLDEAKVAGSYIKLLKSAGGAK